MKTYQNVSVEDFTYHLPSDRIAHYPLAERDMSKLLIWKDEIIEQDIFKCISAHLPDDSLIVFNNTRVVQARLLFRKETGAVIEIFCLEPAGEIKDIQIAFQQRGKSSWLCLVGNAKKWKSGTLRLEGIDGLILEVRKGTTIRDGYIVDFSWKDEELTFAQVLEEVGKTPLPPYISREAVQEDKERYQTIFARHSGSVAAPTAGLHFTDRVMNSLNQKNIESAWLTLHVGAGTFKPVSSQTMEGHQMHFEQIIFSLDTLKKLRQYFNKGIICVGTTSLRSLESLYWLGMKLKSGYQIPEDGFSILQWEPYEYLSETHITPDQSIDVVINYMIDRSLSHIQGETSLLIVPGYDIKMVTYLVTNFHQPKSTLLLLVAAFCGSKWKNIYDYALAYGFRFLSYGDSCLLKKHSKDQ